MLRQIPKTCEKPRSPEVSQPICSILSLAFTAALGCFRMSRLSTAIPCWQPENPQTRNHMKSRKEITLEGRGEQQWCQAAALRGEFSFSLAIHFRGTVQCRHAKTVIGQDRVVLLRPLRILPSSGAKTIPAWLDMDLRLRDIPSYRFLMKLSLTQAEPKTCLDGT